MTGTADTEAAEFNSTYKIDVAVVPTNRELIRTEYPDVVYRSEQEKIDAVVDEILECHKSGQPVLVGTINIEKSEQTLIDSSKEDVFHIMCSMQKTTAKKRKSLHRQDVRGLSPSPQTWRVVERTFSLAGIRSFSLLQKRVRMKV